MSPRENAFGQPIGPAVPGWTERPRPPRTPMLGRTVRIEPLDPTRDAADLFAALAPDVRSWTYLPAEPPSHEAMYRDRLEAIAPSRDPMHHAIRDARTGRALGLAAYLRIDPAQGSIEVGHIHFGPALARRPGATEAMALMMARAFDELGYRRYEWKCDSLNAPSRAAALRYGFTFEGIFRHAIVTKGRSRDTAWFSVTDTEWPRVRAAFTEWLAAGNFDEGGRQRRSLAAIRAALGADGT